MEDKKHSSLRHRSSRHPQDTSNTRPSDNKMLETTSSSSHQSSATESPSQLDPAAVASFSIPTLNLSSFILIANLLSSFRFITNLYSPEGNTEADNPPEIKEAKGTSSMSRYLNTVANMFSTGPAESSSSASNHSASITTTSSWSSGFFSRLPSILTPSTEQIQVTSNGIPQPAADDIDPQQAEAMPDLDDDNPAIDTLLLQNMGNMADHWTWAADTVHSLSSNLSFFSWSPSILTASTEQTQETSNGTLQPASDDIDPQQAEAMTESNSTTVATQGAETEDSWDEASNATYDYDKEDTPQFSM